MKKTVYVALSGGVDSAVAASLLKKDGYHVVGVFMREYDLDLPDAFADPVECTQSGDRQSALAVAAHLGIPFHEWDFRRDYRKKVIDYMVSEYKNGRTPNPDSMCNKQLKFGTFLAKARILGADFIATGHYAKKTQRSKSKAQNGSKQCKWKLYAAKDTNKDQSYFLYTLTQEQLVYTLFPLGELRKSKVRAHAKKIGLPNWNRKDSQGICFIGKLPMKEYLKTRIPVKTGPLLTMEGTVVGTHEGAWYYTIGQRHGIGFGGGTDPYYVVDKDVKKNIVYVAQGPLNSRLYRTSATVSDLSWVAGSAPRFPFSCKARIRYRQSLQSCVITQERDLHYIGFSKPQKAVTPGQAAVFYQGRECLGGGILR
ncbi:tRNA 2-thiouridine(34) synthase MnmA [Candidatus Uhrbacteria bacterium]|nr:tRNA 2-thiouridine(34) synthase MnmA [Candidatus Uhrbacteria bacterium]